MKKTLIVVLVLLLSLLVACDVEAPQTPDNLSRIEAATAPLPYLLPEATLFAVEVSGLAQRWSEIRSIQPMALFQDRLFTALGLDPDVLLTLAGDRVVFALVSTSGGGELVALALLRPDAAEADSILSSIAPSWAVIRARNAVWLGAAGAAEELERVAWGDGTSLAHAVPMDEAELRLPPGGLARGWVNPAAIRECIQSHMSGAWLPGLELIGTLISADLDAVRVLAFRRDIEAGRVVTDAVALYDTGVLPPEVVRVFNPGASGPQLPQRLPRDVAVVAAFRPESEACIPWLRYAAAKYPGSPLRNFDFWIAEFEERSGHELGRDLFGALGDQGWLLGLKNPDDEAASWVTVLEAPESYLADTVLVSLRGWSIEHIWVRTFGMAVPRIRDYVVNGTEVRGLVVRTPFGELAGPAFAAVDGYLLAATSEHAMRNGLSLVGEGAFAVDAAATHAHAIVEVRGHALLDLSGFLRDALALGNEEQRFVDAFAALLASVSSITARVWYEADGIRMHGEVALGDE